MGDYAGFMAMDTAMTSNWHQPIQSIGSSKGDGIMFRHRALVVFKGTEGLIPIEPERDYEIFHAKNEDEEYPDKYPVRMAMLLAQHSASIPDQYSITYTPTSKWNERLFGVPVKRGEEGGSALVMMGMGGRKRKRGGGAGGNNREDSQDGGGMSSPAVSTCSTTTISGVIADHVHDTVPKWVMNGFINAVHRVTMGGETFSANNFRQQPSNTDERGAPEIAVAKEYEGTSFTVRRAPCIVAAAMDGLVSVHKGNPSFIWIASKAKIRGTGEELVYMKCWDPDCQTRIKQQNSTSGSAACGSAAASGSAMPLSGVFDKYGWALLDKKNMKIMDAGGGGGGGEY